MSLVPVAKFPKAVGGIRARGSCVIKNFVEATLRFLIQPVATKGSKRRTGIDRGG